MSFLVSAVVESARSRHAAFNAQRYPDAVAFAALARFGDRLRAHIALMHPEWLVNYQQVVPLPLAVFADGVSLGPSAFLYRHSVAVANALGELIPVERISFDQRYAPRIFPSCVMQEQRLYLAGTAAMWVGYTALTVFGTVRTDDTPTSPGAPVPSLDATSWMPDAAKTAAETAICLGFVRHTQGMSDAPGFDVNSFVTEHEEAWDDCVGLMLADAGDAVIRRVEAW